MQPLIAKLFSPPGSGRKIELDFVRGIAIIMVMAGHFFKPHSKFFLFNAISYPFAHFGGHGVDLFFVLSGFLVGGLLLKEYRDTGAIQPSRFLLRRGLKIWPAFYFMLLFQVAAHRHPLNTFLWQNVFQLQNYLGTSIAQTWTLAVEEHFYLLLTLLLSFLVAWRVSAKRLLIVLGGLCLVSIALRTETVLLGNLDGALRWTQNRIDSLLFGVIIAVVFHLKPDLYASIVKRKALLVGVSLAGLIWLFAVPSLSALMRSVGFIVLYVSFGAFLLLVCEYSGRIRDSLGYRVVAFMGVYSYGLYLWHSAVREAVTRIVQHVPDPVQWPAAIILQFGSAIIIAVAVTKLVEWPFLVLRDRNLPATDNSNQLLYASARVPGSSAAYPDQDELPHPSQVPSEVAN